MDWDDIKYFSPSEFGDEEAQDHTDINLIWLIDEFRGAIHNRIIIHEGYAKTGHSKNSYHYKGQALDVHIENSVGEILPVEKQFYLALSFNGFNGIGFYPYWNRPGIHVDIRKTSLAVVWFQNRAGSMVYPREGIINKELYNA